MLDKLKKPFVKYPALVALGYLAGQYWQWEGLQAVFAAFTAMFTGGPIEF